MDADIMNAPQMHQNAPGTTNAVDPVEFLIQAARTNYAAFVSAVHRPRFKHSAFSAKVCKAVDKFVEDVLAGKRPVLMLTAPPQHGKSSLISRCLPPYLFGRLSGHLPAVRVACASYALPLARRNTKDANAIMGEPIYRAIFPHTSLIGFNGVDNSDGFDVPDGGGLRGVGVKGSLTGFSVECFAPWTLVDTDHGPIRIDELHIHAKTVKVLSYGKDGLSYANIKAVGHRPATRLYRITTDAGRVLDVTGNHPIYCAGVYVPASELAPGDVLLCAVPAERYPVGSGLSEAAPAVGERGAVLQQGMYGAGVSGRDAQLRGLRDADELPRRAALPQVPQSAASSAHGSGSSLACHGVPVVWNDFHIVLEGGGCEVLQPGMQGYGTLAADGRYAESELQGLSGEVRATGAAPQQGAVSLRQNSGHGPRQSPVRYLPDDGEVACAPHRRESVAQFKLEFVDPVRALSPRLSPADGREYESDTVRMVEIIDGPVQVFDVQIETNACLFAAGVLAHNCAVIDDPTKDAEQALSAVQQEAIEAWYESVLLTRLQARSGTVIIGTPWSANDLLARIRKKMVDDSRFTLLSFPALNLPSEIGYNPDLPEGPLVPELHSETKLRELKKHMSLMWWASMYQQAPLADVGAIFPRTNLQMYRRAELPQTFQQIVMSVDATFKDGDASDYVAVGVWGKTADERVWLIDFRRERLAFMATAQAIADLKRKNPRVTRIFIEDAANGAALVDMLKKHFPGLVGVPPLGSKEARAHAVSWVWTNGQVMLPHPEDVPGITPWIAEITTFPDVPNDDTVDCMTIALHQLCLRTPIASMITQEILSRARQ